MKLPFPPEIDICRIPHPLYGGLGGNDHGSFLLKGPLGRKLFVIAVSGVDSGWDHVSVSVKGSQKETPLWKEMCWAKDQFFEPEEIVIQYHPRKSQYVNISQGCLHLWRPYHVELPTPPIMLV